MTCGGNLGDRHGRDSGTAGYGIEQRAIFGARFGEARAEARDFRFEQAGSTGRHAAPDFV